MTSSTYSAEALSKNLLLQISNLIDGNQAHARDVVSTQYDFNEFNVKLNVYWHFYGQFDETRIAGGSTSPNHFGSNTAAFKNETSKLLEIAANSEELRHDFLQGLLNKKANDSIASSGEDVVFHNFGLSSVHEDCSNCGGRGEVRCSSCSGSGNQTCHMCHGSGRTSRQVPQYRNGKYEGTQTVYDTCSYCSGGGRITCSGCHGRGWIRCNTCSGHGFFTYTRQHWAVAQPSYSITTNTNFQNDALQGMLSGAGVNFCAKKIPFSLAEADTITTDSRRFSYTGNSIALEQKFKVKEIDYTCYAFSNPPYAYVKPTIFDDLFADELNFLEKSIQKNGRIHRSKAMDFFSKYAGQPVLDASMRGIATQRKSRKDDMSAAVVDACNGYISADFAQKIAGYLNRIMDKVSPAWSPLAWGLAFFLALPLALLFGEDRFELGWRDSPISTTFEVLLTFFVCLIILSVFAYIFSCLITIWNRRRVPKDYRQSMRNKEPFLMLIVCAFISLTIGAVYGITASEDSAPKLNGKPLLYVKKQTVKGMNVICSLLENNTFQKMVCRRPVQIKQTKISEISARQKIIYIQSQLKKKGYQIKVDGIAGMKTRKLTKEYIEKENGKTLKSGNLIDEAYVFFQEQEFKEKNQFDISNIDFKVN